MRILITSTRKKGNGKTMTLIDKITPLILELSPSGQKETQYLIELRKTNLNHSPEIANDIMFIFYLSEILEKEPALIRAKIGLEIDKWIAKNPEILEDF
jgi:hypothetical protein